MPPVVSKDQHKLLRDAFRFSDDIELGLIFSIIYFLTTIQFLGRYLSYTVYIRVRRLLEGNLDPRW